MPANLWDCPNCGWVDDDENSVEAKDHRRQCTAVGQCFYGGCEERATWWRKNTADPRRVVNVCDSHHVHETVGSNAWGREYWPLSLTPANDQKVVEFLAERGRRLAHVG